MIKVIKFLTKCTAAPLTTSITKSTKLQAQNRITKLFEKEK